MSEAPLDPELVERVARALRPGSFAIFDRDYPTGLRANAISIQAFLNAEKVIKRARKDAAIAVRVIMEAKNC